MDSRGEHYWHLNLIDAGYLGAQETPLVDSPVRMVGSHGCQTLCRGAVAIIKDNKRTCIFPYSRRGKRMADKQADPWRRSVQKMVQAMKTIQWWERERWIEEVLLHREGSWKWPCQGAEETNSEWYFNSEPWEGLVAEYLRHRGQKTFF